MAENKYEENNQEGHFYKGLFFGLLIGVGLVWFLNSESGKEIVKKTRRRIDEALAQEPETADYEFEDEEVGPVEETKAKSSSNPRRFFQKKSK
ncbi:MAG: hypothetical protein A2Z42_03725 [Candidatus Woykebacteria bacterium RBG_19FT_COMBO_43_10]|uniref:YtxH domain-containing protein n=1 Tax=Candidatus Woykebacteria bacterium RBG_19FT_COMBO_43_10 TaxID=1802598 RepID=A0A1G1WKJ0_9BACT|nr:MAG: hypothetical protein A2Z42_03725 [Candidatus Woykebacteria bacterium RBG_19FT_COMBO_43_10]